MLMKEFKGSRIPRVQGFQGSSDILRNYKLLKSWQKSYSPVVFLTTDKTNFLMGSASQYPKGGWYG